MIQERKPRFTSLSGLDIARVYSADDLKAWDPKSDLGRPGEFPYTRGVYPTMYRGRLWTMRQFAGFGTAEDTNQRFKYLLQHGQTGLSVAFRSSASAGRCRTTSSRNTSRRKNGCSRRNRTSV